MKPCPDCASAERDHRHAIYRNGCNGCDARAMAHSPLFFDCARRGKLSTAYRDAIGKLGLEHEDVKAAARMLKGAQ
jgi:hypothetical protein